MWVRFSVCVSAMLSGLTAFGAALATGDARATKSIIHADPAAPNLLRDDRWRPWQDGFVRRGEGFTCDNGDDRRAKRGLVQTVTLNQTRPKPIVASAWSQAEDVSGQPDHNYAVYLDICRGKPFCFLMNTDFDRLLHSSPRPRVFDMTTSCSSANLHIRCSRMSSE